MLKQNFVPTLCKIYLSENQKTKYQLKIGFTLFELVAVVKSVSYG